jgi:hypothetical protein
MEKKTQLFIYRTVTSASAAAARRYETSAAAVARCKSLFARNKMDRELGWRDDKRMREGGGSR